MPKVIQINITANWGSHGTIAEGIGQSAIDNGWESHIAYGRRMTPSTSKLYHIGSMIDEYLHVASTRLLDNHGLMSAQATRGLIDYIETVHPDIIHLHNIHGYYLHYPILFRFLKSLQIPVVWTLHDCWSFTGHCAHYMFVGCEKWQTHCHHCPAKKEYPKSLLRDRSSRNFDQKKEAFLSLPNLTLVPVSQWLEGELCQSFMQHLPIHQIHNGIDVETFKPQPVTPDIKAKWGVTEPNKIVLGVASNWYHKGLEHFIRLRDFLPNDYTIILVGLNPKEINHLPNGIIGLERTSNISELIQLYSMANVFFNPTMEDNFPTTNLEAMSCGTPVVTFDTGGCAECVTANTGKVVPQADLPAATDAIKSLVRCSADTTTALCRAHVVQHFDRKQKFACYISLYDSLLKCHPTST